MKFLTTICIAALSSALFRMLVPEGKFSKQISVLIAALFLLAGITVLGSAELEIETIDAELFTEERGADITGSIAAELKPKICREMSDKIYALLNERGIYPEEIHIIVNISGLYSIDITQVELVFVSEDAVAAEAAAEYLKSELSPDIEITTEVMKGS